MASPLYTRVFNVAAKYVEPGKAKEILERQMAKCGSDSGSFAVEHLKQVHKTLVGAVQLYVTDKDKCRLVADEIQAMV